MQASKTLFVNDRHLSSDRQAGLVRSCTYVPIRLPVLDLFFILKAYLMCVSFIK